MRRKFEDDVQAVREVLDLMGCSHRLTPWQVEEAISEAQAQEVVSWSESLRYERVINALFEAGKMARLY